MQGTYLLSAVIVGALILWPEEAVSVLTVCSLKLQLYFLNLRLKWKAWLYYRQLVKACKDSGLPSPKEFRFVDIWDRNPLD